MIGTDRCIVDRRDSDVDDDGVRAAIAVGNGDGELIVAVVVCIRRVGVAAVRIDNDGAVGRAAVQHKCQVVAIDIGGGNSAADRRVFRCADVLIRAHRCIVDRRDSDVDDDGVRAAIAVGNGDGELIVAVVVCIRRVGVAAVRIDNDGAVGRAAVQHKCQVVAIDIGGGNSAADRRVFRCADVLIRAHRCIVDRRHGQRDGGRIGATATVINRVGDGDRAVEIRCRRVAQRAVRIDHHRAAAGRGRCHRDRIIVRIKIIAEHVDNGDTGVFGQRLHIVIRDRRSVFEQEIVAAIFGRGFVATGDTDIVTRAAVGGFADAQQTHETVTATGCSTGCRRFQFGAQIAAFIERGDQALRFRRCRLHRRFVGGNRLAGQVQRVVEQHRAVAADGGQRTALAFQHQLGAIGGDNALAEQHLITGFQHAAFAVGVDGINGGTNRLDGGNNAGHEETPDNFP